MHSYNMIHRDICPPNIWLDAFGRALLAGLGSPPVIDDSLLNRLSGPGTPGYLSPEQAAGEAVTPAADLFGLGCILYQMATGESPFQGDNSAALFRAVVFDQTKPARKLNPEISESLEDLLTRLLAKMPLDRPTSAREVEQALLAMLDPISPKPMLLPRLPAPSVYPASRRILDTLADTRNIEPDLPTPTVRRLEVIVAPPPTRKGTWLPDLVAGLLLVMGAAGLYLWWKASNEAPPQPPVVKLELGKR
jgi:serine/threonine protein kinase